MNWRNGWPFCDSRGAASSARATMPPVHTFGWPAEALRAGAAEAGEAGDDMIARRARVVTSAPTASTTPAPSWPSTIGRSSGKRPDAVDDVQIAVADAGGDGAHQHLAAPRLVDLDRLDRQRLVHLAKDGGCHFHGVRLM